MAERESSSGGRLGCLTALAGLALMSAKDSNVQFAGLLLLLASCF